MHQKSILSRDVALGLIYQKATILSRKICEGYALLKGLDLTEVRKPLGKSHTLRKKIPLLGDVFILKSSLKCNVTQFLIFYLKKGR